jgi:hypothetical protein
MLPDLLFELDVLSQPLKRMPDAHKRSPVVLLSSSHAYTLSGIGFRVNSQELAIRHGVHGREGNIMALIKGSKAIYSGLVQGPTAV